MLNIPASAAAPTFTTPLDMLRACHGRILEQCNTLHKLLQHLPAHGADLQAQQAAKAILRYFDTAGQFHHQDEEVDLFPLLLATTQTESTTLIQQLLKEHQMMNKAWRALRAQLSEIAAGNTASLEKIVVEHFSAAYERHIKLENEQLLPLAARLLSEQQLNQLGESMANRRKTKEH